MHLFEAILRPKKDKYEHIFSLLKNPKINVYTTQYIIEVLTQDSLVKLEHFMKKHSALNVTEFMRLFRKLVPVDSHSTTREDEFFINYGIFRFFWEICKRKKTTQVTFSDISTFIADKMPTFTDTYKIDQKLLPLNIDIEQEMKKNIRPPQVFGKMVQERSYFIEKLYKSDRIEHINRIVGEAYYSTKHKLFFTIDIPSPSISILDQNFNVIKSLSTEEEISKRDAMIVTIAWSEEEGKIACLFGNFSISIWSREDDYKYEVNVPLPIQYLNNPYVSIKYMKTLKKWIAFDDRPAIYILKNQNYEPEYVFMNSKMRKQKQAEKIKTIELIYYELLCLCYQNSLFLISLKNKDILTKLQYKTAITSVTFSEAYQALFVSTYEKQFYSYEFSDFQDFNERGRFGGHKSTISLLGHIENKPVVFSIQENSTFRMYDMTNFTCYQSFSVLRNILYRQVLYMDEGICLVGSKMHVYKLQQQRHVFHEKQKIIYLDQVNRHILCVSNKAVRIFDIRNGSLIQVIKGVFESQNSPNIHSAYYAKSKKKLFLLNEEGQCFVYETQEMTQVQSFNFEPQPYGMFFDEDNDILVQVSLGNVYIHQFRDEDTTLVMRRKITHKQRHIRYLKIDIEHDLLVLAYGGDDNLYFYSYEKGKFLGYLYFGSSKVIIREKNVIETEKIERIVAIQLFQERNIMLLLLSDELLVFTTQKTLATIAFRLKHSISLWDTEPLSLFQVFIDDDHPIYSTSICLFDDQVVITSNRGNVLASLNLDPYALESERVTIDFQNYNPYRIGSEEHTETVNLGLPLKITKDMCEDTPFISYHHQKHEKIGTYVSSKKLGNLLCIADEHNNLFIYQKPNWNTLAGLVSCDCTVPSLWNLYNYTKQELEEIQFVLKFVDNQYKINKTNIFQFAISLLPKETTEKAIFNITLKDIIKEKTKSISTYRSNSLREKKMYLEKERDEKQKLENFLEHKKNQKKIKKHKASNTNAEKQIHETLGYLSINHNDNLLKKGLIQDDSIPVKNLEKKLNTIMKKDEKKSLVSNITSLTGKDSLLTKRKVVKPKQEFKFPEKDKIMEDQIKKLGYDSSPQRLIKKLQIERQKSQRKLKSDSLPKLSKY